MESEDRHAPAACIAAASGTAQHSRLCQCPTTLKIVLPAYLRRVDDANERRVELDLPVDRAIELPESEPALVDVLRRQRTVRGLGPRTIRGSLAAAAARGAVVRGITRAPRALTRSGAIRLLGEGLHLAAWLCGPVKGAIRASGRPRHKTGLRAQIQKTARRAVAHHRFEDVEAVGKNSLIGRCGGSVPALDPALAFEPPAMFKAKATCDPSTNTVCTHRLNLGHIVRHDEGARGRGMTIPLLQGRTTARLPLRSPMLILPLAAPLMQRRRCSARACASAERCLSLACRAVRVAHPAVGSAPDAHTTDL